MRVESRFNNEAMRLEPNNYALMFILHGPDLSRRFLGVEILDMEPLYPLRISTNMNPPNALIIFAKNPLHGKVKTRLAATIGADKALSIYKRLLLYTHSITEKIGFHKLVYYSDYIEVNDCWGCNYQKELQHGNDLGERMLNAFYKVFKSNTNKAIIIGTDCPQLTTTIIEEAFESLKEFDVVIGPAADGGYYLLGMKEPHTQLFSNIQWSTDTVLEATLNLCKQLNLYYLLLPVLNDIDEEKDLQYLNFLPNE
jgi:rSAM/selenodomain-associated transferase 1